ASLAEQKRELVAIRAELRELRTAQALALSSGDARALPRDDRPSSSPAPPAVAPPASPTAPPNEDPEAGRAQAEAERLVSDALRARRWTERDARGLHREMLHLEEDDRAAMRQKLIVAINRGDLKVETSGMPF